MKLSISLVSLFVAGVFLFSGCSAAAASGPGREPLKVEYTIWDGDYTLLVAQEKGFFEKHGVAVEPVFYETFSKSIPDMASKKIDAGLFSVGDMLQTSQITRVKGVAVYDSGGTSTLVSRRDILSIADLKGQKIGVLTGTYGELFIRMLLKDAGLSIQDVTLVNVDPEFVPERLADDIAAGYTWSPYDQEAVSYGHKVLMNSDGTQAGSLFPDVIVFRAEVVEQRPDDVRAFLAAWFEALEYRQANPDECNELIAKRTNQPVEDVVAAAGPELYSLEDNQKMFVATEAGSDFIYTSVKANLDFLIMNGSVTTAPDLDSILDPSFLQ